MNHSPSSTPHPRSAGLAATLGASLLTLLLAGCRLPGKPGPNYVPTRPDQITNFQTLYSQNCSACHGVEGRHGMAVSLGDPVYIAYAGAQHIADITANGIGGTLMPAFANNAGGLLTDQQIQILAQGIVSRWGKPADLGGITPPPYLSNATGNAAAGQTLFHADCLRCHAPRQGSILDPNYLALVSNGGLRTLLVTGKPNAGMPDWRGYPGGPLSDQQLADLVSFLVAHRTPNPGQPFPNAAGAPHPADAAAEAAEQQHQRSLDLRAGPATGGPAHSQHSAPVATPKIPTSPKP